MTARSEITVTAPAGRIRGVVDSAGKGLFAGIPFAEPPVGPLRLRPPEPLREREGEVDATRFRAAPAQAVAPPDAAGGGNRARERQGGGNADDPLNALRAAMRPPAQTSEDCLYLNVWTPDLTGRRPVIVWIFGGGFEGGDAASAFMDGAVMSRQLDAVVVSPNYRVGALGFGYWAGVGGAPWSGSSNLGLQDQAAALRWVRRNIAAFGGDETNVTVAGESAGAFSIGALLAMPSAVDTFDKAIMQSGSTRRVFSVHTADAIARELLRSVGVQRMEELQAVEVERVLAAQDAVIDRDIGKRNLPGGRSWGVVLDGSVLAVDPHRHLVGGGTVRVPLLIGAARDEAALFRAQGGFGFLPSSERSVMAEMEAAGITDPARAFDGYRLRAGLRGGDPTTDPTTDPTADAIREVFLTDAIYRRPAAEMATAQAVAGGQAWLYVLSSAPCGPALGAFHGSDLIYLFDAFGHLEEPPDGYVDVRDGLTAAWRAFVHVGDPGWPAYDPSADRNTRNYGGPEYVTEPPRDLAAEIWP